MLEIVKSLFYKAKYNIVIYMMVVFVVALTVLNALNISSGEINGSNLAVNSVGSCFYYLLLGLVIASMIIGSDFVDKTINYEIMSGHNKEQMFFGRLIVAFIITIVSFCICIFIPFFIISLCSGWGDTVEVNDFVIRVSLMIFPMVKLIALVQLLCFVLKNHFGAIGLGFAAIFFEFAMSSFEAIPDKVSKYLIFGNMKDLLTFKLEMDEAGSLLQAAKLSNSVIIDTIGINGGVSVFLCLLGYYFFKKTDLE